MKYTRHKSPDDKLAVKPAKEAAMTIDNETYARIRRFVQECPTECQWYNLLERTETATKILYHISDIFIPEQQVGAVDVESDPGQIPPMWKEIKTQRSITNAELSDLISRANMWGHSHVNMPPKPSTTDDQQWAEMIATCTGSTTKNPVGMIIINKRDEYTNRVYDPILGYEFHNLDLFTADPTDYTYIEDALANKLKKKEKVTVVGSGTSGSDASKSSGGSATANVDSGSSAPGSRKYTTSKGSIEVIWTVGAEDEKKA